MISGYCVELILKLPLFEEFFGKRHFTLTSFVFALIDLEMFFKKWLNVSKFSRLSKTCIKV